VSRVPPSRRLTTALIFTLAAVVIVAVPLVISPLIGTKAQTHTFVIPAGTANRVTAGEEVRIIPEDLRLRRSDRLVLINEDSETHQVASILIGSGERIETKFSEAISVSGFCSLHPSGQITISIEGTIGGE
jgi:hypothetical protein